MITAFTNQVSGEPGPEHVALIDIAADLYYQPRFEASSRNVAQFRRLD